MWHTNVTAEPLTLPGQYKYQPYLKPWWNTAYSEMSVKNQIKQAPDKIYLFYTYFRTPEVNRKFLLIRVQTLCYLICLY